MLEGRLRKRLRATGLAAVDGYYDYVFDRGGMDEELVQPIDVVTINKTDFFREPQHFDFLRDVALPELADAGSCKLRVWSSACSSGAEPCTLAMILEDFFAPRQSRGYRALATDRSVEMPRTARRGVYPTSMMAPAPRDMRKYLLEARAARRHETRIHPAQRPLPVVIYPARAVPDVTAPSSARRPGVPPAACAVIGSYSTEFRRVTTHGTPTADALQADSLRPTQAPEVVASLNRG